MGAGGSSRGEFPGAIPSLVPVSPIPSPHGSVSAELQDLAPPASGSPRCKHRDAARGFDLLLSFYFPLFHRWWPEPSGTLLQSRAMPKADQQEIPLRRSSPSKAGADVSERTESYRCLGKASPGLPVLHPSLQPPRAGKRGVAPYPTALRLLLCRLRWVSV